LRLSQDAVEQIVADLTKRSRTRPRWLRRPRQCGLVLYANSRLAGAAVLFPDDVTIEIALADVRLSDRRASVEQQAIAAEPAARIDYISVVDRETLQPIEKVGDNETLIVVAAFFGDVRLIDNIILNRKQ